MNSLNPITCILIDDEDAVRILLRNTLGTLPDGVKILGEGSNIPDAIRLIHAHQPDIVFLDIEMPGYSGLQLLDFFNPEDINFHIVFVTAYNQYALRAFKVAAFDYLLKPPVPEELEATLKRFRLTRKKTTLSGQIELLKSQYPSERLLDKIAISAIDGVSFVSVEDIAYFEASGMYTLIVREHEKEIMASKPIKEFEDLLQSDERFFRTHRSYLVNLSKIEKYSRSEGTQLRMSNGKEIPLSRYRKTEFDEIIRKRTA